MSEKITGIISKINEFKDNRAMDRFKRHIDHQYNAIVRQSIANPERPDHIHPGWFAVGELIKTHKHMEAGNLAGELAMRFPGELHADVYSRNLLSDFDPEGGPIRLFRIGLESNVETAGRVSSDPKITREQSERYWDHIDKIRAAVHAKTDY